MASGRRLALALLWLALLLLGAGWISQRLQFDGDLRSFMPGAQTPAQALLLEQLGEGPGSRLLLLAIAGDDPQILAGQSKALRAALAADPDFERVANGSQSALHDIPDHLRPYRYLLSPTLDRHRLDRDYLAAQLLARMQDLGSPAAGLIEPLLARDPTLEALKLLRAWQPDDAPRRLHGVWFDGDVGDTATDGGARALLVAQTVAAGFDPAAQQVAIEAIRTAFARIRGDSTSRLVIGGPGALSVEIGGRTRREASVIGGLGSLVFVLLLALAYRSWKAPLLGALPLASGGLAGLGAVALVFADGVHGITVAFGFTLIGVAQDYPIHLFSHQRPGLSPWAGARALWPTLGTGVASTCIAYLTFFVSGVEGLQQLAVFTIVGLAVAALSTRFALPGLIDPAPRDVVASKWLAHGWSALARWPRLNSSAFAGVAALALAVVVFAPGKFWENDLSKLTPAPPELLARDARLRDALGAPDVRYLVALHGDSVQAVLRASEALRPALRQLRADGAINGFDMAARYLPSVRTQKARQARLPDRASLREALADAVAGSAFRAGAFAGFVEDVARARAAPALTADDLADTPLALRIDGLLVERADSATALVSLAGLVDPAAVAQVADQHGARLLDLKQASQSLVSEYRQRVLWALGLAAILLAATVALALRSRRRTLRVLAPMALTTLLVLAVLRGFGVELNLFHLVALILAAGLGLDYALFFDHAGDSRAEQLRTLHAVIVCSLTTLLVFSLLALSSIPVLRAIGVPVALGVAFNFVLALLVTRRPATMDVEVLEDGDAHA